MQEVWKSIENYPDYMVSNMGRIKSLKFGKEKIMSPRKSGNGHLKITLNTYNNFLVHRLVAMHFIPNPEHLPEVNHKDEDKTNNMVWVNEDGSIDYDKSNLEWCDRNYNCNYGTSKERISKNNSIPIIQFSKDGYMLKVWNSAAKIFRDLNITHISDCCKGIYNSSGGYIWKYYTTDNYLIGKMNNSLKDKGIILRNAS